MSQELIITRWKEKILSVQVQDRKILQINAEEQEYSGNVRLGDIYVGKVRNIVKNINAAFVEFSRGQMGYLPLSEKVVPIHVQDRSVHRDRVLIGDEIIVQVAREAVKTKPPTLTGAVDLTGRYVVLTIGRPQAGVSKKITDKSVRETLSGVLSEYCCEEYGFIARTNSVGASEEMIRQEIQTLIRRFEELMSYGLHRVPLSCLHKAPSGYLCDIRDEYGERLERILTDDRELYESIHQYLEGFWPEGLDKLELWDSANGKLDAIYNVSHTLEHALMTRVWLKSGAYLVIQPTEAFVSIDVNTGKAISKKKDVQKNYLKVNKEAAVEIAYQLRLRNLSGMILVDFIDMESEEANRELLEALRQAVRSDQMQTTVVDMTKLGIVEMTRKKSRKSLYEQCRGFVKNSDKDITGKKEGLS